MGIGEEDGGWGSITRENAHSNLFPGPTQLKHRPEYKCLLMQMRLDTLCWEEEKGRLGETRGEERI